MKKFKQILALTGAILLGAMYLSTLVFALIGSELSDMLFLASVAATIVVPVLLYGFILIARIVDRTGEGQEPPSDDNNPSD